MQDYLKDIVQHTNGLGTIELIKITGDQNQTVITGIAEDRSVVVDAKFKTPHPDFIGTVGLPNLAKLKTILGIEEYAKDAKITVNTQKDDDGNDVPCGLHFENAAGDFKNDYRYMTANIINDKMPKQLKFVGAKWDIEFSPTVQNIQRLRYQAAANSEELYFTARTENGNLRFYFGDPTNHAGSLVFQAGVNGNYTKSQYHWPIGAVLAILALPGDKTFKMSDSGATMITIDTGLIEYNYILSAQTK